MTHTPGPWKAHRAIWDQETGDVAYILEGVKEARAADSYLITAAPDMLEALDNVYGGCWIDRDSYGPFVQKKITMEEYEAMGIAIKKARGEE